MDHAQSCCDLRRTIVHKPVFIPRRVASDFNVNRIRILSSPIEAVIVRPFENGLQRRASLRELSWVFQHFELPRITLDEVANPRFVARLRQRQEANALAVEQQRRLNCPSHAVIRTNFIIF